MAKQQVTLTTTWEARVNALWTKLHRLERPVKAAVQQELAWRDRQAITSKEREAREKSRMRCAQLGHKVSVAALTFDELSAEYRVAGFPKLHNGLSAKWDGMESCANALKVAVAPLKED